MFAKAIKSDFNTEGTDTAAMTAHSMGGPVSEMLLGRAPKLVKAMVFVDSFFRPPEHYLTAKKQKDLAERLKGHQLATFFDSGWIEKSGK